MMKRLIRCPSCTGKFLGALLVALVWLRHEGCAVNQAYDDTEGYFCSDSGHKACDTFLLYRSQPGYSSVQKIADLFNVNVSSVATLNNLPTNASVSVNETVFLPVDCQCGGGNDTSFVNVSYVIKSDDTYDSVNINNFESLSTDDAIISINAGVDPDNLNIGQTVIFPIRCACPSSAQLDQGVKALVTYPVLDDDLLDDIAASFGVSLADVESANTMTDNSVLYGETTILVPIKTSQPKYQKVDNVQGSGTADGKGKSSAAAIVGIIVGSVVVGILVLCCLVWAVSRHPKVKEWRLGDYVEAEELPELSNHSLKRVSYKHLSAATKAFGEDSKLGQGGFGSVYRGVLPMTDTQIAVKRISQDSNQGEREFMAEVSIISQLRHRNLIQLLGYCKYRGKFLIVYELMPNGSLDKALFLPAGAPNVLNWDQRFNIVLGAARAVAYLHQGFEQQVIHRDIKASNIMLDDKWDAKLGDFGLARLVDHLRTAPTTLVAGTYGYIAPEAVSGKFTEKTDVFAFGAVVLEVACGRKSLDMHTPHQSERILVDWVWERLSEGNLLSVVDKRLTQFDTYWMETLLLLGLLCSHPDPAARPSMSYVVQVLSGEVPVPPVPSTKPSYLFESSYRTITIDEIHDSSREATSVGSRPVSSEHFSGFSDGRSV